MSEADDRARQRATKARLVASATWPAGRPEPLKAAPRRQRRRPLTANQLAVRDVLLETRGLASYAEIAERVGISHNAVWLAIRAIRQIAPVPREQFCEEDEVRKSIAFWDDIEQQLLADLEANDVACRKWGANPAGVGFWNLRLGLLNQLQTCRTNRSRFLMAIGLLHEVPQRIEVTERAVADVKDDDLYHEITATDVLIEELERGLPPDLRIAATGQAEIPADPQEEDHLQGE